MRFVVLIMLALGAMPMLLAGRLQAQSPFVLKQAAAERGRMSAAQVDTSVVMEYAYKGANPEKKGRKDMIMAFDAQGNKTLEARCDAKGEIDTKVVYKFDAQQRCTEQEHYMQFQTLSYTIKNSYNAQNLLSEAVVQDQMTNSSGRKTVYVYAKGNLSELRYMNANGKIGYKDVYTYDAKGNCTKIVRYRADESIDYKEQMSYDDKGNVLETQRFTGMEFDETTAKLEKKTTFKYDDKGNVLEEAVFTPSKGKDVLSEKLVHSYDAAGLLLQTVVWGGKKAPIKPVTLRKFSFHKRL
jgi:hypothetical protein